MGTNAVQRDATAETVSANVKRLRLKQNLGLRGLSKKLGDVGRPLALIEQVQRLLDAAALRTTPSFSRRSGWEQASPARLPRSLRHAVFSEPKLRV